MIYAPDVRRPVAWNRPSRILVPIERASISGIPMLRISKHSHAVISMVIWMTSKYHVCLLGNRYMKHRLGCWSRNCKVFRSLDPSGTHFFIIQIVKRRKIGNCVCPTSASVPAMIRIYGVPLNGMKLAFSTFRPPLANSVTDEKNAHQPGFNPPG